MKLIIQIPAWEEEASLPATLAALPRSLPGFSETALLVIDDGSTDGTAEAARAGFADRVVSFTKHRGLAAAFSAGLEESSGMGADVIVNFDADLQYDPADIPALVAPILAGRADLVVGDRGPGKLAHFSPVKRLLQRLGSWMVRQASGLKVHDATSGLRAFTREAARRMNIFSKMTYTLETLIQAGFTDLRVAQPCPGRLPLGGPRGRRRADFPHRAARRHRCHQPRAPRRTEAPGEPRRRRRSPPPKSRVPPNDG